MCKHINVGGTLSISQPSTSSSVEADEAAVTSGFWSSHWSLLASLPCYIRHLNGPATPLNILMQKEVTRRKSNSRAAPSQNNLSAFPHGLVLILKCYLKSLLQHFYYNKEKGKLGNATSPQEKVHA